MANLDIFNEMGVELEYVAVYPEGYEVRRLNQAEDNEVYVGKPVLSQINSFENETDEFDDSGMPIIETVYNVKVGLIDDEKEIVLDINIKLQDDDDIQKNIHPSSSLAKLIMGILRMKGADVDGYNTVNQISISKLRDIINEIPMMKVKIVEVTGNFIYNSFVVLDPSKDYDGEGLVE